MLGRDLPTPGRSLEGGKWEERARIRERNGGEGWEKVGGRSGLGER
jgi:hypothetical protein